MKNNTKKILVFSVLGMFMLMFAAQMVVADITQEDVGDFSNNVIDTIVVAVNPFLKFLIGSSDTGAEFALKVLAFLMVMIIVYGSLDAMKIIGGEGKEKKWLNMGLGVIVATIGIRFIPKNLLTSMTAPSSALVAILFLGIPFMVFYFIAKDKPAYLQRLMWTMYAILIGTIAVYNTWYTSNNVTQAAFKQFGWIYIVFGAVAFGMGIFGGHIEEYLREGRAAASNKRNANFNITRINIEIKKIENDMAVQGVDDKQMEILQKQLDKWKKAKEAIEAVNKKLGNENTVKEFGKLFWALVAIAALIAFAILAYSVW